MLYVVHGDTSFFEISSLTTKIQFHCVYEPNFILAVQKGHAMVISICNTRTV